MDHTEPWSCIFWSRDTQFRNLSLASVEIQTCCASVQVEAPTGVVFLLLNLIGVQSALQCVLVSALQQSEPGICLCTSPHFLDFLPIQVTRALSRVPCAIQLVLLGDLFYVCSAAQLCPMDCSPPGSSAHGISQARILSGVPFPPAGDLPNPGIKPRSLMSLQAGGFFTTSTTQEAHEAYKVIITF